MSRTPRWRNWAGNQTAYPAALCSAGSEDEVAELVRTSAARGRTVRVVGTGHSFTDIATTTGQMLEIGALDHVHAIDQASRRVTVGAGITLRRLNQILSAAGLALPNLGDIDAQTVAGATATGTHGTGSAYQCVSAAIAGLRLVTANGDMLDLDDSNRPDLLEVARVNLGALGVLTRVTLQCVPAFRLHAVEETLDIDDVLETFDHDAASNDHAEFFWFPGTRIAQRKRNQRTDAPVERPSRIRSFVNDEVLANGLFGAVLKATRRRPALVPTFLEKALPMGERTEYVAPSHDVFCTSRRVRFIEMEYGIPREALHDAFGQVRQLIDRLPDPITFPIECRVLAGDDIPLSMAQGRDSAFIAVHVAAGAQWEAYFAGVESIMTEHGGRPHWGKLHRRTADQLADLYPRWTDFQQAREGLDPNRVFTNPYLDRVLGVR